MALITAVSDLSIFLDIVKDTTLEFTRISSRSEGEKSPSGPIRTDNVLGFEIIFDNIPESRKKIRETKPQFIVSDYQKVVRDFAFVIDEKYSSGEIINLVKKIDKKLIKDVRIFDVYQGDNIASGKKSIAFNVILEPKDKTLRTALGQGRYLTQLAAR